MAIRPALLVALCVTAFVTSAATADAASVTVRPGGAITGSISSTSNVVFWRASTATLGCLRSSFTASISSVASGTLPIAFSNPVTLARPVDNTAGNVRFAYSGCTIAGIPFTVACNGTSNLLAEGTTVSGVTSVRVTGWQCAFTATTGCTWQGHDAPLGILDGAMDGRFNNSASTYTIDAPTGSNQNLGFANSTCMSLVPDGPVRFSGVSSGSATYAVTPATTITV